MITSRQIINISDELAKSIKGRNDSYLEIFVNPTGSELSSIFKTTKSNPKEVRYIIDTKNSKIYVWDAYAAVHEVVANMLGLSNMPYLILGYARFEGNSRLKLSDDITIKYAFSDLKSNNSHSGMAKSFLINIFNCMLIWVDNYVAGFNSYLNERRQEFSKILKQKN
jgi:hypothetical protein